jgi:anti-sigma factor RsiW
MPEKKAKQKGAAHIDAAALNDFVYGRGTPEERLAMASHLAECDACMAELRLTCLMASALSIEALATPPEVALAGLFEHIRKAQATPMPAPTPPKATVKSKGKPTRSAR